MEPITFGPFLDPCEKAGSASIGVALAYTRGATLVRIPIARRESRSLSRCHELYSENETALADALADVVESGRVLPIIQTLATHLEKFPWETTIPKKSAGWIHPRLAGEGFRLTVPSCSSDGISSNIVWLLPGADQSWVMGSYLFVADLHLDLDGKASLRRHWRGQTWASPTLYKFLQTLPTDISWLTDDGRAEFFRRHDLHEARVAKKATIKPPEENAAWVSSVAAAAKGRDAETLEALLHKPPPSLAEGDCWKAMTAMIRSGYEEAAVWWTEHSPHRPSARNAATAVRYKRYALVGAIYARGFKAMPRSATESPDDLAAYMGDLKMMRVMLNNMNVSELFWRPPAIDLVLKNEADHLLPVYFEGHTKKRRHRILQVVFIRSIAWGRTDVARMALDAGFPIFWKAFAANAMFDLSHSLSSVQVALLDECVRSSPPRPKTLLKLLCDPHFPAVLRSILIDVSKGMPGHRARMDAVLLKMVRSICSRGNSGLDLAAVVHGGADLSTVPAEDLTRIAEDLLTDEHRDVQQRRMNLVNLIAEVERMGFPQVAKRLTQIRTRPHALAHR